MVTGSSKLGDKDGLLSEDEMQRTSAADADGGMLEVIVPEGVIAGDVIMVETYQTAVKSVSRLIYY